MMMMIMMLWGYKKKSELCNICSLCEKRNLELACGSRICHFIQFYKNLNAAMDQEKLQCSV